LQDHHFISIYFLFCSVGCRLATPFAGLGFLAMALALGLV